MAQEREFNPRAKVRDVVAQLLGSALPAELAAAAPSLIDRVAEHPDVARHMGKRWGELSEGEGNVIAREVGLVVRDMRDGAGSAIQSGGKHLH